jgi:tetratricopeptide (TPR) repeat protein
MVLSRAFAVRAVACRSLVLVAVGVPTACTHAVPAPAPTPSEIPQLEAALARDAEDVDTRFRLAEAHRRDGRPDGAAALLEPVVAREPAAAFFLALAREDQQQYPEARRLYQDYLARGESSELRQQVRHRLALLERLELQHAVRAALAREQELAQTAPAPLTVGVFPFLLVSDNPELSPLGTAMAELLTTDLAQTSRLTVLERAQVQLLLDEVRLGESGRVDPATAARGGRLLGAGTIVQGRVEGSATDLTLQAAVLRVPTDTLARDPLRERDALDRIFELEKRVALGIYDRLGIQLTPAERQRVLRQPTSNLQALLALGAGLESQDAGRYGEARDHFARALRLDPGFELARARFRQADAQARAAAVPTGTLAEIGLGEAAGVRRRRLLDTMELLVPDPGGRDPFLEAIGAEGTVRHGTAQIVIRRPGGQP